MHTRQGTRKIGRDTDGAAGARAEGACAAGARAEGARAEGASRGAAKGGSRVPECGSVAGSPGRRAAEAAIQSPFQPEGEKLFGEGDGARRKRQAV